MKFQKKLLTELGFVSRGRSQHRPRDDKQLYGGDYPFIQTGDVKAAGLHILSYSQTYNEKGLAQSKLWDKDTLCITIAANIADTSILSFPACIPDSIVGFIANPEESDVRYVKYMFDILQREFQNISQGTSQDNLSVDKLLRIKFDVPPVEIQRRIADILSAYDDLIENNQRQIKLLEEAAMRLYREWFVFMRFPGHESVRIVDGVPEGWQEATIGDMAEYLNGFAFKPSDWKEEGYPIIKIKELTEGVTSDTPKNSGESIPAKYLVKKGDIIFSWSATLFVKIWDLEDGLLNQHLFKVTPLQNVCREFVLQSIQGALPEFYNLTTGSTMVHIQRDKLDRVKRLIPDKEIMRQYEETSAPIREKILSLTSQIYSLQKARDALLPRLMNGGEGLKLEGGAV